ncbi:MAG: OmpA family protein [Bryobacteraceae bacterium]
MKYLNLGAVLAATLIVATSLTGCASKKYVSTKVDPLERRLEGLEKQNKTQDDSLGELGRDVSRSNERAATADSKAVAAGHEATQAREAANRTGEEAKRASATATEASTAAGNARSLAERGLDKAGDVERRVEAMDNFKLVTSEAVLFSFGSSRLTDDSKASLDTMAATLGAKKRYVIEVQGFTDATGSAATNLELSRHRASAVTRYLTTKHNVPLHRIHMLGLGSDITAADNKTREGRKQNRRVEVKLFEPDMAGTTTSASSR